MAGLSLPPDDPGMRVTELMAAASASLQPLLPADVSSDEELAAFSADEASSSDSLQAEEDTGPEMPEDDTGLRPNVQLPSTHSKPTCQPTNLARNKPTNQPTEQQKHQPSNRPRNQPTSQPTNWQTNNQPTFLQTNQPYKSPISRLTVQCCRRGCCDQFDGDLALRTKVEQWRSELAAKVSSDKDHFVFSLLKRMRVHEDT